MFGNKKNGLLIMLILVLGIVVGVSGVVVTNSAAMAIAAPTATPPVPDPRPEPPTIETWGSPDPVGGEPSGCAGQPGCGVMCFYVSEDAAANQHELSCVAWIFE